MPLTVTVDVPMDGVQNAVSANKPTSGDDGPREVAMLSVDDLEFNGGQKKPNGCHNIEAFRFCYENGYCIKLTRCNHPDRNDTVNFSTKKPCKPCHPKAKHSRDSNWTF